MSFDSLNAEPLVWEYQSIVLECRCPGGDELDGEKLIRHLVHTGEWTERAAAHLVDLVRNYGTFMLRNALALAAAAGIEDGELGF